MSLEKPPFLIYIHGFNSSPSSYKARYLVDHLNRHQRQSAYYVPELDYRPERAIQLLQDLFVLRLTNFNITLIGSSLGGYYATFLSEKYAINSVLINPAVAPYEMMAESIGVHANYHSGEEYRITQNEVLQLQQLEIAAIRQPERYMVWLQTGDETLDYRDAAQKYAKCNLFIESGGSHGFDGFDQKVPEILSFAGME